MKKQDPLQQSSGKAKGQDIRSMEGREGLTLPRSHSCVLMGELYLLGHVRPGIAAYSIELGRRRMFAESRLPAIICRVPGVQHRRTVGLGD